MDRHHTVISGLVLWVWSSYRGNENSRGRITERNCNSVGANNCVSAIVLTACTNRKRRPVDRRLTAGNLPVGSLSGVAADWCSRITSADGRIAASRLYCGRTFVEAGLAAKRCGAPLFVVSAGVGAIEADADIPCYSLTVSNGAADNVLSRVEERNASARDWWQLVSHGSPFALSLEAICRRRLSGPILAALPGPYLLMIESELVRLPEDVRERLRIFARGAEAFVDERLRPCVMPYDGRLDGMGSPIRGTQGDFAQRAARHFAEVVLSAGDGVSVEKDRIAVEKALAPLTPPTGMVRRRVTDEEVRGFVRDRWEQAGGQAARMLRVLRDDLRVACEQKRFQKLFREVRAEREAVA